MNMKSENPDGWHSSLTSAFSVALGEPGCVADEGGAARQWGGSGRGMGTLLHDGEQLLWHRSHGGRIPG